VLAFQVFFMTTPFARQPIGMAVAADIRLLNLENFVDDFTIKQLEKQFGKKARPKA
jgi:hypothetical protein